MRKGIFLAVAAFALLAGCNDMGNEPVKQAAAPKWKPPYQLAFATQARKPGAAGVTLPAIGYSLNSKEWERRAALVVRFDASGAKKPQPPDRLILDAVDIPGSGGNLPADYLDQADRELAKALGERCLKGTVKISVALVRSSIRPKADDAEIAAKRLTEWLPAEVVFKNPHPKC